MTDRDTLFAAHLATLGRLGHAYRDRAYPLDRAADAEDLAQEFALAALRRLHRYRPDGGGFEVADAGGATYLVSGYLACVDGRCAVRGELKDERNRRCRVRFIDGQELWVGLELPEYQLEAA